MLFVPEPNRQQLPEQNRQELLQLPELNRREQPQLPELSRRQPLVPRSHFHHLIDRTSQR
jgi:hypothetical protein